MEGMGGLTLVSSTAPMALASDNFTALQFYDSQLRLPDSWWLAFSDIGPARGRAVGPGYSFQHSTATGQPTMWLRTAPAGTSI